MTRPLRGLQGPASVALLGLLVHVSMVGLARAQAPGGGPAVASSAPATPTASAPPSSASPSASAAPSASPSASGAAPPASADAGAPDPPASADPPASIPPPSVEVVDAGAGPPEVSSLALDEPRTVETRQAPSHAIVPSAERPELVIRTLLGLVALLALAYLGGHPKVQRLERRLGISQVITAGFPFVALGLIASHPSIGILTEPVLLDLAPVLRLGLGWIGFIVGFRFDTRQLEQLPRRLTTVVATRVSIAFAAIVAAAAVILLGERGITRETFADPIFLRDAVILGTAGVVTAPAASAAAHALTTPRAEGVGSLSIRVEELAAIAGLLTVAAYFRPQGTSATWLLPGTAWLLITLGLGMVIGILVYAILLLRTATKAEYAVLTLGSIGFASGMAGSLRLSPVVVCFLAGVLISNFPGSAKHRLRETLLRLERPIYLLFLMVAGALWKVGNAHGWILMVAFVAARLAGKWAGTTVRFGLHEDLDPRGRRMVVFAPMGTLAVAVVVNATLMYPGEATSVLVTAVLGAAIVTEVLVQRASRYDQASATPLPGTSTPPGEPTAASEPPRAAGDAG